MYSAWAKTIAGESRKLQPDLSTSVLLKSGLGVCKFTDVYGLSRHKHCLEWLVFISAVIRFCHSRNPASVYRPAYRPFGGY